MNPDNIAQLIQKGFRVTLGATSALVESLQDSAKRDETLSKMQTDLGQLTEEWAEKGAVTEQEARNFVDSLLSQQDRSAGSAPTEATGSTATANPTPASGVTERTELQDLTAQLAELRAELERLQERDSKS